MPELVLSTLRQWSDFYVLVGTAAATLTGLLFIVASLGAGFIRPDDQGVRIFVTPTVVHLAAVLALACLMLIPAHTVGSLRFTLAAFGVLAGAYWAWITWQLVKHQRRVGDLDVHDWLWHVVVPIVGYTLLLHVALMLDGEHQGLFVEVAAVSVGLLLLGIRNAWDTTIWIAMNMNKAKEAP